VALAWLVVAPPFAHALTITIDLELLKNAGGTPMPVSGLVVLTAATSGTFYGPAPDTFAGGDELVLHRWNLSAFAQPGICSDTVSDLTLGGSWTTGDPLRVYWYPTLTLATNAPSAGTPYGSYRSASGLDGSAPWATPAAGDSISLKFFTSDASFLASGGSNPVAAGLANFTVVPEPNGIALAVAGGVMMVGVRRFGRRGVCRRARFRPAGFGAETRRARDRSRP
jgi:hypothetical protein